MKFGFYNNFAYICIVIKIIKDMKKHLLFMTWYIYKRYIQTDWSEYNKLGKKIVKPFYYLRLLYVLLTLPIWVIEYELFINNKALRTAQRMKRVLDNMIFKQVYYFN